LIASLRHVRIGTRRSALAVWQANHVSALLVAHHPGITIELVELSTQGDRMLDGPLAMIGGKGLFVKEIEDVLLRGEVDLAVHSLKDLPGALPEGLVLAAPPPREDPRDALVSRRGETLEALPIGARVGTSSLRRGLQLRALRPDLAIVSVRGNVPTRVAKALDGVQGAPNGSRFDAVMLAAAGLHRLSLSQHITQLFDVTQFVPAVGQGVLGLEYRRDDGPMAALLTPLADADTAVAAEAERGLLGKLGASCTVPLGGHARVKGREISLSAVVGDPSDGKLFRFERNGDRGSAHALGVSLAEELLRSPAAGILTAPLYSAFDAEGLLA
jgi:hydroxymethylbilane synthase